MLDESTHRTFRDRVEQGQSFLLTTHMNPDGDAIGSIVGLGRFLLSRGKQVRLVNQDGVPANLAFLLEDGPPVEVFDPERHGDLLASVDCVVLADNSAPDRLGRMEQPMLAVRDRTLCIDHHPTRGTPWAWNVLVRGACATAAIVYELTAAVGWRPDLAAAQALFVGIATDTGFFRFNSTSARAHEIAAALLAVGVEPARCYQQIHERNSEAYTRLLGLALADLRLEGEGTVASLRITREMVERCRAGDVDTSEMTTALLSMDGVWVASLFRELPDGRVKVSLRSKGDVDVHRLATEFGGGGHRNASGIVLAGDLDGVLRRVSRRAAAIVAERSAG